MKDLEQLGRDVHDMALLKGWWAVGTTDERMELLFAWLHEEVDEAREAWRSKGAWGWTTIDDDGHRKPEGLPFELADIYLIVADIAERLGLDLRGSVETKLEYDKVRRYRRDAAGNPLNGRPR